MPKQTYLTRFSLIIKRLERGPATFEQLNEYLSNAFDVTGQPFSWSRRTLQRDIKDIQDNFRIEILNEQKGDRRYYIADKPENQQLAQRLLNAWELVHILKNAPDYSGLVMLEERKPDGLQHFHGLLYAIQNKKIVTFRHQKFWDDSISQRKVHPLALKESLGRWYLVAVDTKDQKLKTFGLDRMIDIQISKTSYRERYDYDLQQVFKDAFGVISVSEKCISAHEVLLAFIPEQGKYIKGFPLHHSQKVLEETDEWILIQLHIMITYDFVMELMRYGSALKVIQPKSLAEEIKQQALQVMKLYEGVSESTLKS